MYFQYSFIMHKNFYPFPPLLHADNVFSSLAQLNFSEEHWKRINKKCSPSGELRALIFCSWWGGSRYMASYTSPLLIYMCSWASVFYKPSEIGNWSYSEFKIPVLFSCVKVVEIVLACSCKPLSFTLHFKVCVLQSASCNCVCK